MIDAEALAADVSARWETALSAAAQPRLVPVGVATAARHTARPESKHGSHVTRFGSAFGVTVHAALGLVLRSGLAVRVAVERAAREAELAEHLDEACADVERGLAAIRAAGLDRAASLELEYPVAGVGAAGQLLSGFIDLVAVLNGEVVILDFKTDAPPTTALGEAYPEYVEQVESYAQLVAPIFGTKVIKKGLLFTADGGIRWIGESL